MCFLLTITILSEFFLSLFHCRRTSNYLTAAGYVFTWTGNCVLFFNQSTPQKISFYGLLQWFVSGPVIVLWASPCRKGQVMMSVFPACWKITCYECCARSSCEKISEERKQNYLTSVPREHSTSSSKNLWAERRTCYCWKERYFPWESWIIETSHSRKLTYSPVFEEEVTMNAKRK